MNIIPRKGNHHNTQDNYRQLFTDFGAIICVLKSNWIISQVQFGECHVTSAEEISMIVSFGRGFFVCDEFPFLKQQSVCPASIHRALLIKLPSFFQRASPLVGIVVSAEELPINWGYSN